MADFIVTTLDDVVDGGDGQLSLREALALANANGATPDTISFDIGLSGGTLYLTSGQPLEINTDGITIDGDIDGNDTPDITISADSAVDANDASSRVVLIDGAGPGTISATLNGLVIRDGNTEAGSGYNANGGGIFVGFSDALTLSDSIVSNNHAEYRGGGVYASSQAAIMVINSTISENIARNGGGIGGLDDVEITLTGSTVYLNAAAFAGGGIYVRAGGSTVTLNNSAVNANLALGDSGGGIFGGNAPVITLTESTVSGNTTVFGNGGGIYGGPSSQIVLTNSTVSSNVAGSGGGGGIAGTNFSTITLTNATVFGNEAELGGGGIAAGNYVSIALTNSTVSGNYAGTVGGGIADPMNAPLGNVSFTVANSIIAGNRAADSDNDIFGAADAFIGGNIVGQEFILDGVLIRNDVTLEQIFDAVVEVDPDGTPGTGDEFQAGELGDNGGPVQTIALSPLSANPAVNSGDPGQLDEAQTGTDLNGDGDQTDLITTDARGEVRNAQGMPDLGAFELQAFSTFVVTTIDDELDLADTDPGTADFSDLSLREALALANADPDHNVITFDLGPGDHTITLDGAQLEITSNVTIEGDVDGDGEADITVDADGQSRVFQIDGGLSDISATLNGLVIENGLEGIGGGIRVGVGDVLRLVNSEVNNNVSIRGGGIFGSYQSTITLTDTIVSGNSAGEQGGGIYLDRATLTATNTTVAENASGTTVLFHPFTGGGGIYGITSEIALFNSTVSGNSAGSYGGGIQNRFGGTVSLTNVTLSGNHADVTGGGLWIGNDTVAEVTNSTITGNNADTAGGGIRLFSDGTLTLTNTIVAGNQATTDHDFSNESVPLPTSVTFLGANIFSQSGVGDAQDIAGADISDIFASVSANPFTGVQSGTLAGFGGPVDTVAIKAGGIAHNAGINTLPDDIQDLDDDGDALEDLPVDARGLVRVVDGTVDVGAFEAQLATTFEVTILDDTGDNATVTGDLAAEMADGGGLSLREALALANLDPSTADTITFGSGLAGGTLTLAQGELVIEGDVSIEADIDGDGAPDITLDGAGASGVLHIYTGTVALSGLAITGGYSYYGSGVTVGGPPFLGSADVTISNSVVSGNFGYLGGGILVNPTSSLTLLNSTVSGNTADDAGGGIYNGGYLTVINSTVSGNTSNAFYGSRGSGGGIHNAGVFGGTATLINSTVSGNYAAYYGGGLYNNGDLTLINTTVANNSTSYYGSSGGGGLYNAACGCGVATLINSTFTGNYSGNGGGIYVAAGNVTLVNSIVAGNGAYYSGEAEISGPFSAYGINIVGIGADTDASDGVRQTLSLAGLFTQVGTDVRGFDFGVLANNGGPVQTVLILAGGVAHNAGDNAELPETDPFDLDGDSNLAEVLPIDARGLVRILGSSVDIGAVELQNTGPTVANSIADQTTPAAQPFNFVVPPGTFDDADNDPLTFAATLANGDPLPSWLTFDPATQTLSGMPPRGSEGVLEIRITVDDASQTAFDDFLITVTPAGALPATPIALGNTSGWTPYGGNFNGDSTDDLMWRNGKTGSTELWTIQDGTVQGAASAGNTLGWSVVAGGDFNEDGNSDFVWRNDASGALEIWRTSGGNVQSAIGYGSTAGWSVAAIGNFNSDGTTDLIWRNDASGATEIWGMANGGVGSANSLGNTAGWDVLTVGRLDDDLTSDIVWRNQVSGATELWIIENGAVERAVALPNTAGKSLLGAGDVDGDGGDELIWRSQNGTTELWQMNADGSLNNIIQLGNTAGWNLVSVGDVSFDGNEDLIWQNASSGAADVWLMNDAGTVQSSLANLPSAAGQRLIATGDFFGDGHHDLIWRHNLTGAMTEWIFGP